jgi:ligand-binding sensor domain-containing protein
MRFVKDISPHKQLIAKLVLLLVIMCISVRKSNAQNIYMPHYDTSKGLASNHCFYVIQDKYGFIWVATDAGVSRFDGRKFENFSIDEGLPDNQIVQMKEDRSGRIWLMALNGEMSYFYKGKIHNPQNNASLKSLVLNGTAVSLLEDKAGNIWFGTNNNILVKWDGKNTQIFSPSNKTDKYQRAFLYLDKQNQVNAITPQGSFVYNGKQFIEAKKKATISNYRTIQYQNQKGLYWLENQQLKYFDGQKTIKVLTFEKPLNLDKLGYLNYHDETAWICSPDGVYAYRPQSLPKQYLAGIAVNQSFIDRERNTWFATNNGLYKLPKPSSQIQVYNLGGQQMASDLRSISSDNHQKIWLGTADGKIKGWDNNRKLSFFEMALPQIKSEAIKQIAYDTQNDQIFFASDFNLGYIKNPIGENKVFNFLREQSNQAFVVKSFAIDTGSKIAIAMSSGVLLLNHRDSLSFATSNYQEGKNFFSGRSYRVYFDKAQQLWFSNIAGLNYFNYQGVEKINHENQILSNRVNDIVQLADGSLALATDGYGIIILKDNKIAHLLSQKNGLASNIIKKLYAYHQELWTVSNAGVNRIIFSNNTPHIQPFNDINEANEFVVNDLIFSRDTAYFASNKGLICYPVQSFRSKAVAPQVVITSVISNDKKQDIAQQKIILAPGDQNLVVNFSAVDFNNQTLKYRYRLKNNRSWIESKNSRLEFSSLEPGNYDLAICVKTADSNWSEPCVINIIQRGYFYETGWFMFLLVVLGGLVVYRLTLKYSERMRAKEQEKLLMTNKVLSLEQQALQAMMNPHFVFNVMNSLQHYINTQDTSKANKVLTGFAKLIRKNLDISAKGKITLAEELDYLALYLSLEKYRFGEKLTYHFEVDETIDLDETCIPTMLLQPFIENAIWHGIMPKDEGGKIWISIAENNDVLAINIEDDGLGVENAQLNKKSSHTSKGLALIYERIQLLNQINAESISLKIYQTQPQGGTTVQILINASPQNDRLLN